MLPEFAKSAAVNLPRILIKEEKRDVSAHRAFPCGAVLDFEAIIPRTLAARGLVMRIHRDTGAPGEETMDSSCRDLPFEFVSTDFIEDRYTLRIDTAELCAGTVSGLFYYEYLFLRGLDTLFSDSRDNVNFTLSDRSARAFRLLVYDRDFETPEVGDGIMYHIFVDRFYRGKGSVSYSPDAVLHKSTDEIPEYAAVRGGDVANNDFFGGNLWGVAEKLPYLKELGVSIIYLSPVFLSPSNHKYDTSDYTKIDPGFGGEEAFERLLAAAKANGIKLVLDGVFNHTGSDSIYFDAKGKYGGAGKDDAGNSGAETGGAAGDCAEISVGAGRGAANPVSPYHSWYRFGKEYKHGYECWWDIDILPRLRTDKPEVREYFAGNEGICRRYSALGCGWRLDVADELPDDFLEELRSNVKKVNPEALIIGEVWENAADKVAYGRRRSYFRGRQLDSVMNYPLRRALLDFGAFGDAARFGETLTELYSSYPKCVCDCLMNLIGTHDTYRALSFLGNPAGVASLEGEGDNAKLAAFRLTEEQYKLGIKRLKAVSFLQYTVFGFPCVFYADETGMEGLLDPFCRLPMKWGGKADAELLEYYRKLGGMRRAEPVFAGGDFCLAEARGGLIVFERTKKTGTVTRRVTVCVNCGSSFVKVKVRGSGLYSGRPAGPTLELPPYGFEAVLTD